MGENILIPGTIWITGITASGKTTLGKALYNNLITLGYSNCMFLDGEDFRETLDHDYGYSLSERMFVTRKYYIPYLEAKIVSGNFVIAPTVAHKVEMRSSARKKFKHFMEVHLKCPTNVCASRDYKGHYKRAYKGEKNYELFPGVTDPFEVSDNIDLVLDTDLLSIEKCSEILLEKTLKMFHRN